MATTPTLDTWRTRMAEDMRLADFQPRTEEAYLLVTRMFFDWVNKEPVDVSDDDLRRYFAYLREERKLAPSSIHIALCGLRFFFVRSMQRGWGVFDLLRVKKPRKLPVVLSRAEVREILTAIRHPVRRMALTTIYSLGLRLGEGLALSAEHIDGGRLTVWIRHGKGNKDRGIPLPRPILGRLRHYWKTERPASSTNLLFLPSTGDGPFHETTIQKTFSAALVDSGIAKDATVHTLRHSYATHLLEAGISIRTIQHVLGHKSLRTTEIYTHLTQPGVEHLQRTLDRLMRDL